MFYDRGTCKQHCHHHLAFFRVASIRGCEQQRRHQPASAWGQVSDSIPQAVCQVQRVLPYVLFMHLQGQEEVRVEEKGRGRGSRRGGARTFVIEPAIGG